MSLFPKKFIIIYYYIYYIKNTIIIAIYSIDNIQKYCQIIYLDKEINIEKYKTEVCFKSLVIKNALKLMILTNSLTN